MGLSVRWPDRIADRVCQGMAMWDGIDVGGRGAGLV